AALEKFLKDHPDHEQFTPDAMFRLADLYIDLSEEEFEARLTEQEKTGKPADSDQAQLVDYSRSLALWEQILSKFPSYRQTPSTLYLYAYYNTSKDERKSLA